MGKIVTEKDFWECSKGNMPAPIQGTVESVKKIEGDEKYIIVANVATLSWVDFSCKDTWKLAVLAAIVVAVIAVAVIGTGGMALIAVGALAGAAYGAFKCIEGALLCGQKMAGRREWQAYKPDLFHQGVEGISSDCVMVCPDMGGVIKYNPNIKNWSQAIAAGSANYIGTVLEYTFKGACIGATFAGGGAILKGGLTAIGRMGAGQALKGLGTNVLRNWASTVGINVLRTEGGKLAIGWMGRQAAWGLSLRGVMGVQGGLAEYGQTGEVSWETAKATGTGVMGMELGTAHAAQNLTTFDEQGNYNGSLWDVGAIALWGVGSGRLKEADIKLKPKEEMRAEEEAKARETKPEEVKPEQKENNAYEDPNLKLSPKQRIQRLVEAAKEAARNAESFTELENIARQLAKDLYYLDLGTRHKPNTVSFYESASGERYVDVSYKGGKSGEGVVRPDASPNVKAEYDAISKGKQSKGHGNCGEVGTYSQADKGGDFNGGKTGSYNINHKTQGGKIKPIPACKSCKHPTHNHGVTDINKPQTHPYPRINDNDDN